MPVARLGNGAAVARLFIADAAAVSMAASRFVQRSNVVLRHVLVRERAPRAHFEPIIEPDLCGPSYAFDAAAPQTSTFSAQSLASLPLSPDAIPPIVSPLSPSSFPMSPATATCSSLMDLSMVSPVPRPTTSPMQFARQESALPERKEAERQEPADSVMSMALEFDDVDDPVRPEQIEALQALRHDNKAVTKQLAISKKGYSNAHTQKSRMTTKVSELEIDLKLQQKHSKALIKELAKAKQGGYLNFKDESARIRKGMPSASQTKLIVELAKTSSDAATQALKTRADAARQQCANSSIIQLVVLVCDCTDDCPVRPRARMTWNVFIECNEGRNGRVMLCFPRKRSLRD